jgi:tetratricopeptide (TPR) repeat protein
VNEYRQALDQIFSDHSTLPRSARKEYSYRRLPAQAAASRRAAWDHALSVAATGKLADAARAFEQLVKEDEGDAAAWFNLAVTRAWEGNNAAAVDALDRHIPLEGDENQAAEAAALAEVLRCGQGMEDKSDYVSSFVVFGLRDPQAFLNVLAELERERRLVGVQVRQEEGILHGMMLEKVQALTPELAATAAPRLAAFFILAGPIGRLWHLNRDSVETCAREIRERAGAAIEIAESGRGPANFVDITCEWLVFPFGASEEDNRKRVQDGSARFLEETWIHRPLVSLNRIAPIDAAGHASLRKKLLGTIQFLQECSEVAGIPYDFERLRRKLGLISTEVATESAAPDIASLGASELAALVPESLSDEQSEQAYQAALKLDARELAGRFARDLVARPAGTGRPDRFPWFSHLVQLALAEGDADAALQILQQGEQLDTQHNESKRRNDYELRRGQVFVKKGDIDQAQSVFDSLIARAPAEARYRGSAAEAMLSARQMDRARRFAEEGLALARKQNDRDSEEYFKELVGAGSSK